MDNQNQITCGDRLPPLSGKHVWLVAQMLESEDKIGDQVFYTAHDLRSQYKCRVPELLGKRIRGSFHGWVILSDHPHNVMWSLWNPSTSKVIRLPPMINHEDGDVSECCLPSPPDDPGSILLLTRKGKPTFVFCRLDRESERLKWTELSYAEQIKNITGEDGFVHTLTCCNSKVYALDGYQQLFVIEVDILVTALEVVISVLPFVKLPPYSPVPGPDRYTVSGPVLKGSCTALFIIYHCYKKVGEFCSMRLFKLDMTRKLWEEMEDFDDAACFFFLDCSSTAIASKSGGGYIHALHEENKVMYSFHVKDKILITSSMPGCQDLQPPPRSRTSYVSVWAMPECTYSVLEGDHGKINHSFDSKEEDETVEVEVSSIMNGFNIPFHVLEMIMEFCTDIDYVNFRATCKQLTAPVTRRSNGTSMRRLQRFSLVSPWLMVLDKDHRIITFTDPMFGDQYSVKTPPEITGDLHIWYSMYGWLLMSDNTECILFFNPFTNDIRKLPNLELVSLESFCFSAPPSSPNCMVVGFGGLLVFVHFVAQKPASWLKLFLDFGGDAPSGICFVASCGRDLYALNEERRLNVFTDFWDEASYSWVDVDVAPTSYCSSLVQNFLVKKDKDLLLVMLDEFGKSVELFKLNRGAKKWEEIHGLGKHMIYICDTTCLCMEARTPEMENKLCFALLHPENAKIVFYSLDSCRYHTFSGKSIVEGLGNLFGTKQHLDPHVWIEPSYS